MNQSGEPLGKKCIIRIGRIETAKDTNDRRDLLDHTSEKASHQAVAHYDDHQNIKRIHIKSRVNLKRLPNLRPEKIII